MMWARGYLSADQMAGAFQLLRANDLVWSRRIREYLMGERAPMTDLMAWNADSTRMPYRMHAEYLQKLYLDNELAGGRFMVEGRPTVLQNIRLPLFVVGTERDHVAPWQSVYKIHDLSSAEITFVLASGGHNAGILSEPGHPRRRYRVATRPAAGTCRAPEEWAAQAVVKEGSWWAEWAGWLAARSAPDHLPAPPAPGAPDRGYPALGAAPGTYVLTILAGGRALTAPPAGMVPFVVWFNTLAGLAYVAAGVGLWRSATWAAWLAAGIALATAAVLLAFLWHVVRGGAWMGRTPAAMGLRIVVWSAIAVLAFRRR
jgi:hypothetical protein